MFIRSQSSHFILGISKAYCHTWLHLGYSARLRIWQVSAFKMESKSGIFFCLDHPPTQPPTPNSPPTAEIFLLMLCGIPDPIVSPSTRYVRCPPIQYMFCSTPIVPPIKKVCAVSPLSIHIFSLRYPIPHSGCMPLPHSALS